MHSWSCRYLIPLGIAVAMFGLALTSPGDEKSEAKQKWTAPAGEAQKKNPVSVNESSLATGRKIYLNRCASCHGTTGNGDGADAIDAELDFLLAANGLESFKIIQDAGGRFAVGRPKPVHSLAAVDALCNGMIVKWFAPLGFQRFKIQAQTGRVIEEPIAELAIAQNQAWLLQ